MKIHQRGYTLIELLVVNGIMGIAFSFVIVNSNNNNGMALKSSPEDTFSNAWS